MNNLIVWWLSANQMKLNLNLNTDKGIAIFDQIKTLPEYIQTEFCSLQGRNARGRLWINEIFSKVELFTIPEKYWNTPLADYLAEFCGGIVIRKSDYK